MAEKEAASVITSENSAEFYNQKLGLADETVAEVSEPVEQSEPVVEEAKPTEEKKPNPKLEKRFEDVTKQRDMARQEAERERQKALELEQKVAELLKKNSPAQSFEDVEPQPSQFADAFEYAKALSEYAAENAVKQMKKQDAEAKILAERQAILEVWNKRQEAIKAELPDYEAMITSADVVVSDQVRDAIIESDVGPRILYHLAENPEFAESLSKKSVTQALREIGKLEAKYEKTEKAPEPVVKSNAPKPITPLKAASTVQDVKIDTNGQYYGSYAQWKADRKAGRIR